MKSKIQNGLPFLALLVIIIGQLNYLPARRDFLRQLLTFAQAKDSHEVTRLAYGAADYDLLTWVEQETSPETTLLLLTASPRTYGDPSYVLYHRAIYHLYPRRVWWAAPVLSTRYPAWWTFTALTEADILIRAQKYQATTILADGFARPPVSGPVLSFDDDTHLIFLEASSQGSEVRSQKSEVRGQKPVVSGQWSAVGGLFSSLGALLSIWLWGDLFYELTIDRSFARSSVRRVATAWLLGCGVTSLITFILLWAGLSLNTAVASLSLLGCVLWLFVHYRIYHLFTFSLCHPLISSPPRLPTSSSPHLLASSPPRLPVPGRVFTSFHHLFCFIILLQVGLVALAAWVSPLVDWDAWVNWASKANALFIDQTLSPNLYHNPARLPTNMDYPLMLPLVEAWFYSWLGQIHEPAIGLISLLFYSALLLLFYDAARRFVSPTAAAGFTALLATIPRLERPAHSGLVDIPLAALVLLSFLFLFELFKNLSPERQSPPLPRSPAPHSTGSGQALLPSPPPHLLALALTAGFLPWLKNEGWLWWMLVSLSLLVGLGLLVRRKYLSSSQAIIFFLIYFVLASAIPLVWQCFLSFHGTYRFTFLPLTLANFWANLPRLPLIGLNMLTRLLNPYWNFAWLLAGLIFLLRRQRILLAPLGWLILPVMGYLALISFTYLFSRFEPFLAHLNNSAERLILQAVPLVGWWLIGQSVALGWVKEKSKIVNNEL